MDKGHRSMQKVNAVCVCPHTGTPLKMNEGRIGRGKRDGSPFCYIYSGNYVVSAHVMEDDWWRWCCLSFPQYHLIGISQTAHIIFIIITHNIGQTVDLRCSIFQNRWFCDSCTSVRFLLWQIHKWHASLPWVYQRGMLFPGKKSKNMSPVETVSNPCDASLGASLKKISLIMQCAPQKLFLLFRHCTTDLGTWSPVFVLS